MSAGPISQWWRSHLPPRVSTPDAHRICAPGAEPGRAYCGRSSKRIVDVRQRGEAAKVTCSDCLAAARADEAAS